jgi:hypothetical protein
MPPPPGFWRSVFCAYILPIPQKKKKKERRRCFLQSNEEI